MTQRVSDRSLYETYFQCPRKRYWAYEHKGRGVTRSDLLKPDLLYGTGIHNGMDELTRTDNLDAAINHLKASLTPIEEITPDGHPTRDELLAMGTGHLTIYHKYTLPMIRKSYTILTTEMEIIIKLSDWLTWMTRLDSSMERKRKGELPFVCEYKTSGYEEDLIKQATVNFQFHMEAAALEHHYREKGISKKFVGGTILLILSKGVKRKATEREQKDGLTGVRRISPLTYAYWKKDPFASLPNPLLEWQPTYHAGWHRIPTWIYPGTEEYLSEKYFFNENLVKEAKKIVFMPPAVPLDRERLVHSKQQILAVEGHIMQGVAQIESLDGILHKEKYPDSNRDLRQKILNEYFPQNSQNCENDAGYHGRCEFYGLCHEGEDDSLYFPRIANHPYEDNVLVPLEE